MNVPIDFLRQHLSYNPETGEFTWIKSIGYQKAGTRAGTVNSHGYRVIYIKYNNKSNMIYAHRLAWAFTHNKWPDLHIDHRNRNNDDNAILNLRETTRNKNMLNKVQRVGKSGKRGVYWNQSGWLARVVIDGKSKNLGTYPTIEEAYEKVIQTYENHTGHPIPLDYKPAHKTKSTGITLKDLGLE